jgi:hypothetical protein
LGIELAEQALSKGADEIIHEIDITREQVHLYE